MIFVIFAKFSGSLFFTHRIFGAVNPVKEIFAVYSDKLFFSDHVIQIIAFLIGTAIVPEQCRTDHLILLIQNATRPCICPPKLIPAT